MMRVEPGTLCYICHRQASDIHHMIHGPDRKKAEEDGLVVPLCRVCHSKVHFGGGGLDRELKRTAQLWYEEEHTRDEWMKRYGRNHLC